MQDGKPLGIDGAVSHACDILSTDRGKPVDRSTVYRWLKFVSKNERKSIVETAQYFRPEADTNKSFALMIDNEFHVFLALNYSDEENFKFMHVFLSNPVTLV